MSVAEFDKASANMAVFGLSIADPLVQPFSLDRVTYFTRGIPPKAHGDPVSSYVFLLTHGNDAGQPWSAE
jgi:hypothetical protein